MTAMILQNITEIFTSLMNHFRVLRRSTVSRCSWYRKIIGKAIIAIMSRRDGKMDSSLSEFFGGLGTVVFKKLD